MSESAKINEQEVLVLENFEKASQMLSPLWDIRDYVAVNPFFGLREKSFLDVAKYIKDASGYHTLPKKNLFLKKYERGEITIDDLEVAKSLYKRERSSRGDPASIEELLSFIQTPDIEKFDLRIKSLSDYYDMENHTNMTDHITNEVSRWAGAYFDEGQALWKLPTDNLRLFTWWRSLARFDKPFKKNSRYFLELIHSLPDNPEEALQFLTKKLLGKALFSIEELTDYYYRLIQTVFGWASFIKSFEFEANRSGDHSKLQQIGSLIDIVAIRMTYDIFLLDSLRDFKLKKRQQEESRDSFKLEHYYIWLSALENSYRRSIEDKLKAPHDILPSRFDVQMAFCIDVRSELLRRHLENLSSKLQTIGFAGFFGMPISIKALGSQNPDQNCPILLNSTFEIEEINKNAKVDLVTKKEAFVESQYLKKLTQSSANSGFSFVETMGLGYIVKMLTSSLNKKKPNIDFSSMGLSTIDKEHVHLNTSFLSLEQKVNLAYSALSNMGLIKDFAKYVFFFGHGSESANNPYASALDCGACAGHNGLPNAKLLASLLNEKEVRKELESKNVYIPKDTLFLSGWHNTTTDKLSICETSNLKEDQELNKYRKVFEEASQNCREERARKLPLCVGIEGRDLQKELTNKANDWSEIRPEWGLARNASFIIARRSLTRKINLDGRSFLHDYDYFEDSDLAKLELIMTAPMIVTNWINMQYYASTVHPQKFGAGNKALNNVIGTIGCVEGNGSDLLGGLTEQSVFYNGDYYHEPIRLQVFIEAETSSIEKIIHKHQIVKDLVLNSWLSITSIDPISKSFKLYQAGAWIDTKEDL